jgi:predicted Zn-dependent protease
MKRWLSGLLAVALVWGPVSVDADEEKAEKLEGYAEWREDGALIVDGQRVRIGAEVKFKGKGDARDFASIPLGYEVEVKGTRRADGTVLAREVEAEPNGSALFENDLSSAFDEMEAKFRGRGRMYEEDQDGEIGEDYGLLRLSGPDVERVRRIAGKLLPPYLRADGFRIYVVENDDWNAMAAPNQSIYVFSGLLRELDDDELAVILGHELAHATHEHSRRQFKRDMIIQLAALGVVAAAESLDSKAKRTILQVAALLGATAWSNGYGRNYEDQADRVGLRYAFEAGYDVRKGPHLWSRFASKYGNTNKVVNFFFSDHSVAEARAKNLERELALNYEP